MKLLILYTSSDSKIIESTINKGISKLAGWFQATLLVLLLSKGKTELVHFGTTQRLKGALGIEIAINGTAGSNSDAPAEPFSRQLRLPSIAEMIRQESARMVYKAINGQAPLYLSSLFNSIFAGKNRMLRNSNLNLGPPRMKTKFGQNCFAYRGEGLRFGTHCLITVEQLSPFQHLI